ncbi:hypothetical protein V5O48_003993 [Marasmius crinis-equi]|uniref:F-box domain-containing protein n=1 Tax=Marasmius crinis-equi TaxID=585013 RepID=A0ABR3FRB8_9AGAR
MSITKEEGNVANSEDHGLHGIEKLSKEIFHEIVLEVCATEFVPSETFPGLEPVYPIKISHQCRRVPVDLALVHSSFRDSVYGLPSLWSRMSIRLQFLSGDRLDALRGLLSRSGSRPLELLIRGDGLHLPTAVKEFLVKDVLPRASRIDCEWDFVISVDYERPLSFPGLTHVQILDDSTYAPKRPDSVQRQQIRALIGAPRLTQLCVNSLDWLGSCFIILPTRLVEFRVTDDIRMSRLVDVQGMLHLRSLLISIDAMSVPRIIPDLVFAQVTYLSVLLGQETPSEVLRHLWVPRVEDLRVELRTAG